MDEVELGFFRNMDIPGWLLYKKQAGETIPDLTTAQSLMFLDRMMRCRDLLTPERMKARDIMARFTDDPVLVHYPITNLEQCQSYRWQYLPGYTPEDMLKKTLVSITLFDTEISRVRAWEKFLKGYAKKNPTNVKFDHKKLVHLDRTVLFLLSNLSDDLSVYKPYSVSYRLLR